MVPAMASKYLIAQKRGKAKQNRDDPLQMNQSIIFHTASTTVNAKIVKMKEQEKSL